MSGPVPSRSKSNTAIARRCSSRSGSVRSRWPATRLVSKCGRRSRRGLTRCDLRPRTPGRRFKARRGLFISKRGVRPDSVIAPLVHRGHGKTGRDWRVRAAGPSAPHKRLLSGVINRTSIRPAAGIWRNARVHLAEGGEKPGGANRPGRQATGTPAPRPAPCHVAPFRGTGYDRGFKARRSPTIWKRGVRSDFVVATLVHRGHGKFGVVVGSTDPGATSVDKREHKWNNPGIRIASQDLFDASLSHAR